MPKTPKADISTSQNFLQAGSIHGSEGKHFDHTLIIKSFEYKSHSSKNSSRSTPQISKMRSSVHQYQKIIEVTLRSPEKVFIIENLKKTKNCMKKIVSIFFQKKSLSLKEPKNYYEARGSRKKLCV